MKIIPIVITSMLLALFNLLVMHKCMNMFFIYKKNRKTVYIIIWVLYYLFQFCLEATGYFSPDIALSINIIFVFAISFISYKGSMRCYLAFSILVCAIWMLAEVVLHIILGMFGVNDKSGLAGPIISKLVMLVFAIIAGHFIKRSTQEISIKYVLFLLIVPVGSI